MADKQSSHDDAKSRKAAAHGFKGGPAFVANVVGDPNAVPAVYVISGYPGAAGADGQTRLYLGPDLSSWVEIPQDAVVHVEAIPGDSNWLGAVLMWVKQDAQVTPGNRWSQPPPSK
jgi:hypothetical protein